MRDLNQDSRSIAGVVFAPASTAMVQIVKRSQAVTDNCVRLSTLQVDDEAHAAAIVFVARVVQPLCRRLAYTHLWLSLANLACT